MGDKVRAFVNEVEKDRVLEMTVGHGMGTPPGQKMLNYLPTHIINCLEDPDINSDVAALFDNAHSMMCRNLARSEALEKEDRTDIEFNQNLLREFERICAKVGITLES